MHSIRISFFLKEGGRDVCENVKSTHYLETHFGGDGVVVFLSLVASLA